MRKLPQPPENALRAAVLIALQHSLERRFMHRLDAVLLISQGKSCAEVAHWFGQNSRTIERWVRAYTQHGIDGIRGQLSPGRKAQLKAQEMQCLALDLANPPGQYGYPQPRWSGKLLARHIAQRYRATISERHCQRLLKAQEAIRNSATKDLAFCYPDMQQGGNPKCRTAKKTDIGMKSERLSETLQQCSLAGE